MANKTLRTLIAGAAIAIGDLFLTRQGADTEDKSITGTQLRSFIVDDAIANGTTDKAPSQNAVFDALALKSDVGHGHAISDVSGLQTELDGKQAAGSYAAASHSHASSDITDLTEATQDAVGLMVNATLTYVDGTPSLGVNLSNPNTWAADQSVPDEAYGAGWNGSMEVPTKNAVYDKIETISASSGLTIGKAIMLAQGAVL